MSQQRMAGEHIMQKMQQVQSTFDQYNQRAKAVMDRQRERDIAAAFGEFVPFSQADII